MTVFFCFDSLFLPAAFFEIFKKRLFVFVVARLIVDGIFKRVGKILLSDPMIFKIVGIEVALSLFLGVLAVKVLVLQLPRDGAGLALLYVTLGGRRCSPSLIWAQGQ